MSEVSLDDYVDVAERIGTFKEIWPEGTLQTLNWNVHSIADRTFVVYQAAAYRTPTDPRPGIGMAWEPFPGETEYTHNSELMNAETSAWGRAIIATGITSKRIASKQEVKARKEEKRERLPSPVIPKDRAVHILKQAGEANLLEKGNGTPKLKAVLIAKLIDVSGQDKITGLNVDQAETLEAWIANETMKGNDDGR